MDNVSGWFQLENTSLDGYLNREQHHIAVPMTLFYSLVFLTGVIGNMLTCSVICRKRIMQTCTNCYLFSLAVSDLLQLFIGLPVELYKVWCFAPYPLGRFYCKFGALVAEASANASVLTVTAFTIERYVAICHPFRSKSLSRLSRAIRSVVLIWILACGLALPQALHYDIIDDFCVAADRWLLDICILISAVLFFVFPMVLISALYIRIAMKLNADAGGLSNEDPGVGSAENPSDPVLSQRSWSRSTSIQTPCRLVRATVQISERKAVIRMLGENFSWEASDCILRWMYQVGPG